MKPRAQVLLAAALIALAALAAYANSFSGPFIFDDAPSIAENPTIRQLWPVTMPLRPPEAVGVGGRPLLNLSYAVNYAIGGTDVRGYHALNLLIHILAGLTLFGVARRTLLRWSASSPTRLPADGAAQRVGDNALHPAFAIALLWTLHPLQTASVTYVSQRAESLMGLFYLLVLYGFIRYVEADGGAEARRPPLPSRSGGRLASVSTGWAALSVLACVCGMATKEVMVTAPVMVFLYDRTFVAGSFRAAWRRRKGYYGALAGSWLLLGWLLLTSNPEVRGVGFGFGVSSWNYLLTECGVIVRYLGLALWPNPLVLDDDTPIVHRLTSALPGLVALVTLLAAAVSLAFAPTVRRRLGVSASALGFVGCGFFLVLAPTSSVVPVAAQAMAENRMYLPLAAVVTLAVLGIQAWAGRMSGAICLALALGLGWLTWQRNQIYRSELSIWSDTVQRRPGNPRAHYLLANLLLRSGRAPEAIPHYEQAVRLNPLFPEAWNGWGFALAGSGRMGEAIGCYEQALRLKPAYPEADYNLANALEQAGRAPEAIARYEAALRLRPAFAEAEENLGSALLNTGRAEQAAAHYAAALRLAPGNADVHYDLGLALRALGRLDEARAQFALAARLGGHP